MKKCICLVIVLMLGMINGVFAQSRVSWNEWVSQLRQEAISQGINPRLFDDVFSEIKQPNRRVLHFDKTQPEKRLTFNKYRKTRIDPYRITLGARAYKKHKAMLNEIGQKYGVSPCFILSFWGIESSYGHFKGNFPVIKSLATLAYDSRRGEFFRGQLLVALHILNDGHVSREDFKGEWAGASGHPQFLPTSWKRYAVDYNQDGLKDIWNTYPDVFASIANYLVQNGWQSGQPWAIEVKVPKNFPESLEGRDVKKTVQQWVKMGVKPAYGFVLPKDENMMASIVQPYGGPSFMAFQNFNVIMRYNNSTFYAGSVGFLADQICKKIHKAGIAWGN